MPNQGRHSRDFLDGKGLDNQRWNVTSPDSDFKTLGRRRATNLMVTSPLSFRTLPAFKCSNRHCYAILDMRAAFQCCLADSRLGRTSAGVFQPRLPGHRSPHTTLLTRWQSSLRIKSPSSLNVNFHVSRKTALDGCGRSSLCWTMTAGWINLDADAKSCSLQRRHRILRARSSS